MLAPPGDECPPPLTIIEGSSLFLDLDGTLLELQDRPDRVIADDPTRELLRRLAERLPGRFAVVSGRSIAQIDAILGPVARHIAVSGSHGLEQRFQGFVEHPVRPPAMDAVVERFRAFAQTHEGVLAEDKSFGAALHFRMAPEHGLAARRLAIQVAAASDLVLQDGKMMIEVRLPGGDKGGAIRKLMTQAPMSGTRPVFAGDDVTDEDGFRVVQAMGGLAIMVGELRPTKADFFLANPAALRAWLEGLVA